MVYPPNSINTEFERHIDDGFYFDEQGFAIVLLAMVVSNATFLIELRRIKGWEKYANDAKETEVNDKEVQKIKKHCYVIPSKLYLYHAFVPVIATVIGLVFTRCKTNFNSKTICGSADDFYYHRVVDFCFLQKSTCHRAKRIKKYR